MTHRTQAGSRLPRDLVARDRLRRAQQDEARAVSDVCAAQDGVTAARRKRDRAVAAADAVLAEAERVLAIAQAHVVEVSGIARATTLLGISAAALRRARALSKTDKEGGEAA